MVIFITKVFTSALDDLLNYCSNAFTNYFTKDVELKVNVSGHVVAFLADNFLYYYDPVSDRRFRPKKEVFDYLGLGTSQRPVPKPMAEESVDSYTSSSKATEFDDNNGPETVRWVLNGPGSWTPFIGEEQVPKSTKKAWDAVFERRMGGQN
ncbi:methyl-CpG-binding domain-containing protein 5-like [Tasmannia lanceolata]|uniref:methyl-CpG-binding domain-containing protein 5-like n=1 Tax=Tasmannia lanceolata TaxID=3420 RepID=UPI004062E076